MTGKNVVDGTRLRGMDAKAIVDADERLPILFTSLQRLERTVINQSGRGNCQSRKFTLLNKWVSI